jgi:hypothetical protein
MSTEILLHDKTGKPLATLGLEAQYAHPYSVGLVFRTRAGDPAAPDEFTDRVAVKIPYEEFERLATWFSGEAARFAKEGFLNKRVWPANLARHAQITGRPWQDPVVVSHLDGTETHVALTKTSDSPETFELALRSVPGSGVGEEQPAVLARVPMTSDEANELAIHAAVQRHARRA